MPGKPTYEDLKQKIKIMEQEAEQHRAIEDSLKQSQKKYRELYHLMRLMTDNAPDLIWAKDVDDRHIFVNKAVCDKLLMASDTDEPVGKKHLFFTLREREKGHRHTFGEMCEDSDAVVKDIRKPRRFLEDGFVRNNYLMLDVNKAPFYDEAGNMIGTVGCGRDVTHEKQTEMALRESEKRFREIIEEVSEISIQGYDEERNVIFWNHASEKMYGYTEEEALGRKLEDIIIPPAMGETVKNLHHRWMTHGEKIPSGELTLINKNGNDVHVFSSHVMQDTINGKEMFCIDIDLTPIKNAEKEKRQLREQLIQSQKMEAVGTLTSGISHDFNNILQVIRGFTDYLMLQMPDDETAIPCLKEIQKTTNRAAKLIRRMMLFSRKAPPSKQPVNINDEVKQIKKLMEKTIPKMIAIETNLPNNIWDVNVDPVQIEQMILNLGINAADAMPEGGSIYIKTANKIIAHDPSMENIHPPMSGNFVQIAVSDTGHGMDKDTLQKAFEPFFTTKGPGKGTGLGLASVYGIVKNHDGFIRCHSEPNQGTVFKIYLPTLKNAPSNTACQKEKPLQRGTETILMVDDEASITNFASKALDLFGYKSMTASSGEDAIEIYKENQKIIDLIILDINMPGMGGFKCLNYLSAINPALKVIVSSGYSEDPMIQKCLDLGAMAYLSKPYKILDMLNTIRDVLDSGVQTGKTPSL